MLLALPTLLLPADRIRVYNIYYLPTADPVFFGSLLFVKFQLSVSAGLMAGPPGRLLLHIHRLFFLLVFVHLQKLIFVLLV